MDVIVTARIGEQQGTAIMDRRAFPCIIGRSGLLPEKREGDGGTPIGSFPVRGLLYRADRMPRPITRVPCRAICADMGWCDDPGDPQYNRLVRLPYPGRHEDLWLDSSIYDIILVIGHNDDPVVPGAGSAVFVHLQNPEGTGTAGCVSFALRDLLQILESLTLESRFIIREAD